MFAYTRRSTISLCPRVGRCKAPRPSKTADGQDGIVMVNRHSNVGSTPIMHILLESLHKDAIFLLQRFCEPVFDSHEHQVASASGSQVPEAGVGVHELPPPPNPGGDDVVAAYNERSVAEPYQQVLVGFVHGARLHKFKDERFVTVVGGPRDISREVFMAIYSRAMDGKWMVHELQSDMRSFWFEASFETQGSRAGWRLVDARSGERPVMQRGSRKSCDICCVWAKM